MSVFKKTCNDLTLGESCVIVKSSVANEVVFQYQSAECDKCILEDVNISPNHSEVLTLDFASLGTVWQVVDKDNKTVCGYEESLFQETSWHNLTITNGKCSIVEVRKADPIYDPIFVSMGIYVLLCAIWVGGKMLYRKKVWYSLLQLYSSRNASYSLDASNDMSAAYSSSSSVEDKQKQARKRLRSLDTVRGIAIIMMIFVNYGGGQYWFFDHTPWNGLTIADLVFPWFIWMMGMSMALSLRSLLRKTVTRKKIFFKIVKRSVILYLLGLMLNTFGLGASVALNNLRMSGVLQRFALSYLFVATIHLFFAQAEDSDQEKWYSTFRDIWIYKTEWLIMITFLIVHIVLTFLVYDKGCPSGYLGPGGLHDGGQYYECTGGAAGYIDRVILGKNHLYKGATINKIYKNDLPYDPEGILGYLTSIFLVYLGLQAGKILLTFENSKARIVRWLLWSFVTGILAMLLSKVSKNDGWIPINKNLWSVSFIFATGSMAFLLITICYFVIDVKRWWDGSPFYYSGMNSILLYVGHSMTGKMFPWSWQVADNHASQLAINLWATSLWVIISIVAFHANFFVTV